MKIAVPAAGEKMCTHFGHCEVFYLFDVDLKNKKINNKILETPPPHEPGVLPRWLSEMGVNLIIAGGMGSRAKTLFRESGIEVITGALPIKPNKLVEDFLLDNIVTGENACDH